MRRPAVAGIFYPGDADPCRAMASRLIAGAAPLEDGAGSSSRRAWIGGLVPHAGWVCSGAIAAQTIATLARSLAAPEAPALDVVVVFGAVHTPLPIDHAVLDSYARWDWPGAASPIAVELRERIGREAQDLFAIDDRFHLREHAVEVELPLLRQALPEPDVLPVEVPLIEQATDIGRAIARQVMRAGLRAVFLASSDLTHYGPAYRFAPAGVGPAGLEWARDNDRRMLERIQRLAPEEVIAEAGEHSNACGGGAIAAMLSACREFGAAEAMVLRHASSFETLSELAPQEPDNAVGYASVVVG